MSARAAALATPAGLQEEAKRVQVGDQAPTFTLESIDGVTHSLEELRGEKNAIVIFFRGAW